MAVVFISCSPSVEPVINKNPEEAQLVTYSDNALGYSIMADKKVFIGDWSSRRTSGGQTAHSLWNGHIDDGKDSYVDLYHLDSNCSPTTLGVSKPKDVSAADTKTLWGKVDFWKIYGGAQGYIDYDGPHPLCHEGNSENGAAYAFCSEKDGKTVLICISQVSDNPNIANQIFDSFKWTK